MTMTLPNTISDTALCLCLHVYGRHDEGEACAVPDCRCSRFLMTSCKSRHHHQRGQRAVRKRVARLEVGDQVLVGFPGYTEWVHNEDGSLAYEEPVGDEVRRIKTTHTQDYRLRFVEKKTGAYVATVTGRRMEQSDRVSGFYQRRSPSRHIIETDLGELPPMAGLNSVLVQP
jgi:hypothetical protein